MAAKSRNLLKTVKDHPIGAIAVGGGVVAGVILVRKAAMTASRVVTLRAATRAATDVAKAVRRPASRKK